MTEKLNGLTRVVKSLLVLFAILVPVSSGSFAFGGYLATRTVQGDLTETRESIQLHRDDPMLHVVTSTELARIDRRLCLLMEAQNIADADCP